MTERAARLRLMTAIEAYVSAHAGAEWANGHRVGEQSDDDAMCLREMEWWRVADVRRAAMKRRIAAFARVVRQTEQKRRGGARSK